jgi:hypothetical protein
MEELFLLIKPVIDSFMRSQNWMQKKEYLSILKKIVKTNGSCDKIASCDNCPFYQHLWISFGSNRYGHICNYILKNSDGEEQNKLTLLCAKHAIAKFGLESTIQERSPF